MYLIENTFVITTFFIFVSSIIYLRIYADLRMFFFAAMKLVALATACTILRAR